jgi:hypothetical protein
MEDIFIFFPNQHVGFNIGNGNDVCQLENTKKLLKPETEEFYRLASRQITVTPCGDNNYSDILSEEGLIKFRDAETQFLKGDFKDTISNYMVEHSSAGFWFKDPNSHFNTIDDSEMNGCLNAPNNITIIGKMSKVENILMRTNVCIFVTDQWCLTNSGSIYKLSK